METMIKEVQEVLQKIVLTDAARECRDLAYDHLRKMKNELKETQNGAFLLSVIDKQAEKMAVYEKALNEVLKKVDIYEKALNRISDAFIDKMGKLDLHDWMKFGNKLTDISDDALEEVKGE